jgi:hypothetical protein
MRADVILNAPMKSIISLLAILAFAALTLVGCNQNTSSNSTNSQSTNSSMPAQSIPGGFTNLPPTNSLPGMITNMSASTNQ